MKYARVAAIVYLSLMPILSASAQQMPQADAPKPGTASIAGRVVAADTGRPLAGVTLRLVSFEVMRVAKSAVTDGQGRYEFKDLLPGRYQLDARAERYLPVQYGQDRPPEPGKPIDLRDAERFDRADFVLRRPGAIEGRLVDEFGDAAPNVIVQVSRLEFAAGRRRLMPVGGQPKPTDDRGQFRISGLAPGAYYVMALSGAFSEQNASGGFAPTFYPGTTEAGDARPVQVGFGETVANVAFPLVPARMARLSGMLVAGDGTPLDGGNVMLVPSDRTGIVSLTIARGVSQRGGTFTFRNVPPGAYTLQAYGPPVPGGSPGGLGQATFGWLPVTIGGKDIADLVVIVGPGVAARGRIVFNGDAAPPPNRKDVIVFPRPVEFDSAPIVGGGLPPFSIRDDWTFEVLAMSGLRVVRVDASSAAWSLERVSLDGKDVTDEPIDFRTKDVEGLEIVLTTGGASVSGGVTEGDGKPASNYSVIVFADNPSRWKFPSRFVVLGRPTQDGRFKVQGLPPENYLAVALPSVTGSEWQDPAFLQALAGGATRFTLSEGEAKSLDLKLVRHRAARTRDRATGRASPSP